MNIKKYQKTFQKDMFKLIDSVFPQNGSKENRNKALLLGTALGFKFRNILIDIKDGGPSKNNKK